MPNMVFLAHIVAEINAFIRTEMVKLPLLLMLTKHTYSSASDKQHIHIKYSSIATLSLYIHRISVGYTNLYSYKVIFHLKDNCNCNQCCRERTMRYSTTKFIWNRWIVDIITSTPLLPCPPALFLSQQGPSLSSLRMRRANNEWSECNEQLSE